MSVIVTKTPQYPASQRAPLDLSATWDETTRLKRTCQFCRTVYLHAGAAYTCEHSPHPTLTAP